jgi:hypothetical protein
MRLTFALAFALLLSASPVTAAAQSNGLRQKVEFLESALESALGRITQLETQLVALQSNSVMTLDGVLSLDPTTHTAAFHGVNVQIVNGAGQTDSINGLGNLIVGYDEENLDSGSDKTRSHNFVAGSQNSYSSFGGVVLGYRNAISGPYSNVTGGRDNTAAGHNATVSGGLSNRANGRRSLVERAGAPTVSGGNNNIAEQVGAPGGATVSGGGFNSASAGSSVVLSAPAVSGGTQNTASGSCSAVSGGVNNRAGESDSRGCSTILGGHSNRARGYGYPAVVGGLSNAAVAGFGNGSPVVVGGESNSAGGTFPVVLGGQGQTLHGAGAGGNNYATIPPIP